MKPVKGDLSDRYHRESAEGFDAVLGRMMEVIGNPLAGSYAMALDVSENTLKTWRRRGAVSMKYLQEFAKQHGVSLDYLLHGDKTAKQPEPLSNEELMLIERYRASPRELRDAVLRVLLGGEKPKKKIKQVVSGTANQLAGGSINQKGATINVEGDTRGRRKK